MRQVKRLWRAYQQGGPKALISRKRGRPGNRRLPPELRARALTLIHSHYADFGLTLAHEKLSEVHRLRLSVETVRQVTAPPDRPWPGNRRGQSGIGLEFLSPGYSPRKFDSHNILFVMD